MSSVVIVLCVDCECSINYCLLKGFVGGGGASSFVCPKFDADIGSGLLYCVLTSDEQTKVICRVPFHLQRYNGVWFMQYYNFGM